jgi:hypothetical protein
MNPDYRGMILATAFSNPTRLSIFAINNSPPSLLTLPPLKLAKTFRPFTDGNSNDLVVQFVMANSSSEMFYSLLL